MCVEAGMWTLNVGGVTGGSGGGWQGVLMTLSHSGGKAEKMSRSSLIVRESSASVKSSVMALAGRKPGITS